MFTVKHLWIVFFAFLSLGSKAQQDSLLLPPSVLGTKDIQVPPDLMNEQVKIVSGSRFPVEAGDLPFTVFVITKEEIRQNGYETLVDALKMVPGIRVSQPGSANEGETFLMRGLLGNTYAKILINDVPVKPSFVAAMPIGAQLPIKEAERIEVIYGAGAALYGSDAAAGIVNIITRESDKPVFMQADLSVGGGVYSSVNVMFGGRLGRDKRIFKYFAYGSNVLFEKRKIFYDQDYNYRPSSYAPDSAYAFFPNYGGTVDDPILTNTPHLSRKFGFNLKYKRFTLSAETMYRRDHSSLGLNPVAYSYRNPQTYTGEAILRFNLNLFKDEEKRNRKTDFTYLRYQIDSRSSILPVRNRMALMLMEASMAQATANGNDSAAFYFGQSYGRYLNGQRYMFGNSDEFRVEHVRNYRMFKYLTLTLGANAKFALGRPLTSLLSRPVTEVEDGIFGLDNVFLFDNETFPIASRQQYLFESNGFSQLFYNRKAFSLAAGANYTYHSILIEDGDEDFNGCIRGISPRVSGIWKVNNQINLRSSWGTSFRAPNPYHNSTSYSITAANDLVINRVVLPMKPEKSTSWESGVRYKTEGKKLSAELSWFQNKTSSLLQYGRSDELSDNGNRYLGQLGYSNLTNSSIRYRGGQATLYFLGEKSGAKVVNGLLSYSWIKSKVNDGGFNLANFDVPQYSGRILQFHNSFHPFEKTTLIVDGIRYRNIGRTEEKLASKFWVWDVAWRYAFSDRFDGYLKIINLFNRGYSGIKPNGDPIDLLHYNPQSGFFIRLGMNYYIE